MSDIIAEIEPEPVVHAPDSPSKLGLRSLCGASGREEARALPPYTGQFDDAFRGTVVHGYTAGAIVKRGATDRVMTGGNFEPDFGVIPADDEDARQMVGRCWNFLLARVEELGWARWGVRVEQRVECIPHPVTKQKRWGWVDLVAYDLDSDAWLIIDWKFGWLIPGGAESTFQIYDYLMGAAKLLKRDVRSGVGYVYAPNISHVGRAAIPNLTFAESAILAVLERSADPNAPYSPGNHCVYCRGLETCVAAREKALTLLAPPQVDDVSTAKQQREAVSEEIATWAAEKLAPLVRNLPLLEAILKAADGRMRDLLQSTPELAEVFGYKMIRVNGQRAATALALYVRLQAYMTLEEFLQRCSPKIPEIEKLVATRTEIPFGALTDSVVFQGSYMKKQKLKERPAGDRKGE